MLGIGDYLKDEFARRIEHPRDEDDKIFHLFGVSCDGHGSVMSHKGPLMGRRNRLRGPDVELTSRSRLQLLQSCLPQPSEFQSFESVCRSWSYLRKLQIPAHRLNDVYKLKVRGWFIALAKQ
jgi:hypothetical protein